MKSKVDVNSIFIFTILALIWGSSFILIKKGLVTFEPMEVAAIRVIFAFAALSPVLIFRFRKIAKKEFLYCVLVGFLGNLIPAFLFALAQTNLKSSLTGILNALTPLMTLMFAVLLFKNKLSKLQLAGLLIGFIGSASLSFVGVDGGLGSFNFYVIFVILATICYAMGANLIAEKLRNVEPVYITTYALLSVVPVAIIILLNSDVVSDITNHPEALQSLGYLALLGVFATSFALILFNRLIKETSAVFASNVTYLIPIIAVFWGLLDNEILYPLHYVGMVLIIVGVYISGKVKMSSKS